MRMFLLLLTITLSSPSFGMNTDAIRSYVYCVEGYKFLYVYTSNSSKAGVDVTQIMENHSGRSVPLECDGTESKRI